MTPNDDERAADDLDAIYDALQDDDPERALELARRAAESDDGAGDPVVAYLAGRALLELDRPDEAAAMMAGAVQGDPDDAEFRAGFASALFRSARFGDARREARAALDLDDELAEAHDLQSQLADRLGDAEESERHARRAAELEPDVFPVPPRLTREAFEAQVARAIDMLPDPFRERLDEVAVTVDDVPSDDLLDDPANPIDPELLGLFVGVPLTDRSFAASGDLPPRIFLFKRNLERFAPDEASLAEEIVITLRHELAHYLGMDEDEIADAGYD